MYDTFRQFYSQLYTSEADPDHSKMTHFSSLDLPKLDREQSGFLDYHLTLEDLRSALTSMKRGKSPGLDGIPPELFLEIWDTVRPLILGSINHALKHGEFHRDKQGCPLSPTLFALSLEPLAQAIRLDPLISPIKSKGTQHKVSLYADDTLFYFSDISISLPQILK